MFPSEAADWRSGDRVGCIANDVQTVALVEAVPSYVGHGGPKCETRCELSLCFFKQRSTNALTLKGWCNEKLVENAALGDRCKQCNDMIVNYGNTQTPAIFQASDYPRRQGAWIIEGGCPSIHPTGAFVPNGGSDFVVVGPGQSDFHILALARQ